MLAKSDQILFNDPNLLLNYSFLYCEVKFDAPEYKRTPNLKLKTLQNLKQMLISFFDLQLDLRTGEKESERGG